MQNTSNKIRWSLDLRWANHKEATFHDIKPVLPLMEDGKILGNVDWEGWNELDRHKEHKETMHGEGDEEFDTTISGPWMAYWEMVHENRHTDAYFKRMGKDE